MPKKDQNFDELVAHFEHKVYGSLKGKLRLKLLKQEFSAQCLMKDPLQKLKVLDVAGGLSQMAIWLAKLGHEVTVADISINMLQRAKEMAQEEGVDNIQWLHCPLQQLPEFVKGNKYDLVMAHAILEWLDQPLQGLQAIEQLLSSQTLLSLSFYNHHAITIHNLLRGNFHKVNSGIYRGEKGGLTPLNPIKPEWIREWCVAQNVSILSEMGLRTFSDYIPKNNSKKISEEDIIAMEMKLSHQQPFIGMARYVHFLGRKKELLDVIE